MRMFFYWKTCGNNKVRKFFDLQEFNFRRRMTWIRPRSLCWLINMIMHLFCWSQCSELRCGREEALQSALSCTCSSDRTDSFSMALLYGVARDYQATDDKGLTFFYRELAVLRSNLKYWLREKSTDASNTRRTWRYASGELSRESEITGAVFITLSLL